jgi:uncharacterized protein
VPPPAWWADEMLGRLARYLRMVGEDTAYETGLDDEEVLRRATEERRVLITRDRLLAQRAPGSVLLSHVLIDEQWRELRGRFPTLPNAPRMLRCTLCNGRLRPSPRDNPIPPFGGPDSRPTGPVSRCETCGHVYWEGSHTESVRQRLARWSAEPSR